MAPPSDVLPLTAPVLRRLIGFQDGRSDAAGETTTPLSQQCALVRIQMAVEDAMGTEKDESQGSLRLHPLAQWPENGPQLDR